METPLGRVERTVVAIVLAALTLGVLLVVLLDINTV